MSRSSPDSSYLKLDSSRSSPDSSYLSPNPDDSNPDLNDFSPDLNDSNPDLNDSNPDLNDFNPDLNDFNLKVNELTLEFSGSNLAFGRPGSGFKDYGRAQTQINLQSAGLHRGINLKYRRGGGRTFGVTRRGRGRARPQMDFSGEADLICLMSRTEESPGVERTLSAEVKLYYDLHAPAATPAPLLVALHGYGSNKGWMMREARQHAPEGFALAALQGPHQHLKEPREKGGPLRYGFGWLTNFHPEDAVALHQRALQDLIDALVRQGVARRDAVFLLGFSQSCALNYRFAFTHGEALRGCVGICGGMPGDWETSGLYGETRASVLHLHGERDEFYPPARVAEYGERLSARARDVEVKGFDAGHEITPAMRAAVRDWLAARA
jgi:phospholipase/carboxylesterase